METVKVSSKGQIVIPKALRDAQHITAGTQLIVSAVGDELRLIPARAPTPSVLDKVAGCLNRPGIARASNADDKQSIGQMLLRRDEASKR